MLYHFITMEELLSLVMHSSLDYGRLCNSDPCDLESLLFIGNLEIYLHKMNTRQYPICNGQEPKFLNITYCAPQE
jgi:hypothetical protein